LSLSLLGCSPLDIKRSIALQGARDHVGRLIARVAPLALR
jgi:hypothetical protein